MGRVFDIVEVRREVDHQIGREAGSINGLVSYPLHQRFHELLDLFGFCERFSSESISARFLASRHDVLKLILSERGFCGSTPKPDDLGRYAFFQHMGDDVVESVVGEGNEKDGCNVILDKSSNNFNSGIALSDSVIRSQSTISIG